MTTKTHDSNLCELGLGGEPCEFCVWANEQEREQFQAEHALTEATLERIHALMAEDCDCELHRLSSKDRIARIDAAIGETDAMIVNGDFAPNFECAWLTAPPEYKRYTEENHALYWYLRGMADEQRLSRIARETLAEDVAEMRRLTKERLG
jgi:hypothetical protein